MRRSLVIANWKMNGSVDFIDQWTNVFTTFSPVNTELAGLCRFSTPKIW